MPSANIEYHKPATIQDALNLFFSLKAENKFPIYYAGGTEILTLDRLDLIETNALIDIKGIKECYAFDFQQGMLRIGTALPLTYIEEKNLFPLLTQTSIGISDHTARNKITLGGNLCGQIFYREAVLPFLLCDSITIIAGTNGIQMIPIGEVFRQSFQLEEGQILLQLLTEQSYINRPFMSIKKRQQWETGYPLLTIASIKMDDGEYRFAFSGLCPFPFRSKNMENIFNSSSLSLQERIDQSLDYIPGPVLDDVEGSKEYRLFVLRNTLEEIFLELEGK
ncbi:MAG TPA: xanthine dehydrogenase [Bacillus bacterium]|nr:xanthine dehydrogenase [Bacillus sp. (in: firmicutes)]